MKWMIPVLVLLSIAHSIRAEDVERARPAEWEGLVYGGRFMDRFLPLPDIGPLTAETWGTDGVKPRHVENGLEDYEYSYWGGNIHVDESGTYHLFVCRWREDDPNGHMAWPHSEVAHAVADHSIGPYRIVDIVGEGHNPELHQLKDGRYFLYASKNFRQTYYIAEHLNGPWELKELAYDPRQRRIDDHMANNTFTQRSDGSMLMVGRGGGIWISKTGLPPYRQITSRSVYPPFDGRYEDPVIWKTDIQYHLIVNDWLGRIAYYMRSMDGINWKLDAGEAYLPGIARHQDGRAEEWYKFERIKVLQDQYGRAYQANFAVCDIAKKQDRGSDCHSSKNISIPLTVGRLIEITNGQRIDPDTDQIKLLVKAEPGFNPHLDMDIQSLRFGAPEEVDFGRGSRVLNAEQKGIDLLVTFAGTGNGLSDQNFAAKLLGRTTGGELLFGFARLPWVDCELPALSALFPEFTISGRGILSMIELENFGVARSGESEIRIEYLHGDKWDLFAEGKVPALKPFEKANLSFRGGRIRERDQMVKVRITILQADQEPSVLEGPVVVR